MQILDRERGSDHEQTDIPCSRSRLRCLASANAFAALKVVTTTQDLESITREVGGDKVTVESLAKGYQDPHFVEAKPSFILKLHSADLLVVVGRELEIGWLPPLINQAATHDPAGRRSLPRRVADREDPRDSDRPDHAGDG